MKKTKSSIEWNNPRRVLLFRVSTNSQDFDSQMEIMRRYFESNAINSEGFSIGKEYVSGRKDYRDRLIYEVINSLEEGSTIYVSELSRLGRSVADVVSIAKTCSERGIVVVFCKDNLSMDYNSPIGKVMLTMLAMIAEFEAGLTRERVQAALDAIKDKLERGEVHVSKSGRVITHLGQKSAPSQAALDAAALKKRDDLMAWFASSPLVEQIRLSIKRDMMDKDVIALCGDLYDKFPETYCTRQGKKLGNRAYYRIKGWILSGELDY